MTTRYHKTWRIRAFSLVELMIVVALLGILAAMVLPEFRNSTTEAKEAAAKNNLHILRAAINLYASQNNGIAPGYPIGNPDLTPIPASFKMQMIKYLSALPENPLNDKRTIRMIANSDDFPLEPTGEYGWVYQPQTSTIRIDSPGTDKTGTRYYDY